MQRVLTYQILRPNRVRKVLEEYVHMCICEYVACVNKNRPLVDNIDKSLVAVQLFFYLMEMIRPLFYADLLSKIWIENDLTFLKICILLRKSEALTGIH